MILKIQSIAIQYKDIRRETSDCSANILNALTIYYSLICLGIALLSTIVYTPSIKIISVLVDLVSYFRDSLV